MGIEGERQPILHILSQGFQTNIIGSPFQEVMNTNDVARKQIRKDVEYTVDGIT